VLLIDFTMENIDETLLTLYVSCPALYDKSNRDYSKGPIIKENLWKSISIEMNLPGMLLRLVITAKHNYKITFRSIVFCHALMVFVVLINFSDPVSDSVEATAGPVQP
jgi:hypothetical protein